jgi:hypothetical protein
MLASRVEFQCENTGMRSYLETFERRNLVRGVAYDRAEGHAAAERTVRELMDTGRTIVLLGSDVRAAFSRAMHRIGNLFPHTLDAWTAGERGLPPVLVHPQMAGGCTWRQIPHPSGRNLFYNDPRNRETVAMLLEELYLGYHRAQANKER